MSDSIDERELEEFMQNEKRNMHNRGNSKKLHVILEDGTEHIFDSNKEFSIYFNKKYNTNFRQDIAWYIIKDRNKKAKQVFQIKKIEQI